MSDANSGEIKFLTICITGNDAARVIRYEIRNWPGIVRAKLRESTRGAKTREVFSLGKLKIFLEYIKHTSNLRGFRCLVEQNILWKPSNFGWISRSACAQVVTRDVCCFYRSESYK